MSSRLCSAPWLAAAHSFHGSHLDFWRPRDVKSGCSERLKINEDEKIKLSSCHSHYQLVNEDWELEMFSSCLLVIPGPWRSRELRNMALWSAVLLHFLGRALKVLHFTIAHRRDPAVAVQRQRSVQKFWESKASNIRNVRFLQLVFSPWSTLITHVVSFLSLAYII